MKKVSIDIDDVVINLMKEFFIIYNKLYNTSKKIEDANKWNFYKDWGLSSEIALKLFREIQLNVMSSDLLDSSVVFYWKKICKICNVDILTARNEEVTGALENKLATYGIIKGMHYGTIIASPITPNHSKIFYDYDIYIDDNPNLADHINGTGKILLLYDQPWNQTTKCDESVIRVKGWKDVYNTIKKLI